MPITKEIIKRVAEDAGITVDELTYLGFLLFSVRKGVRLCWIDQMCLLGTMLTLQKMLKKIKDGEIPEHPAWEDLIFLENLESAIALIDEDIETIRESS